MRISSCQTKRPAQTPEDLNKLSANVRAVTVPDVGQALVPMQPTAIESVEVIDVEYDDIWSGPHDAGQAQQPVPVRDSFEQAGPDNFKYYQNLTAFNEETHFANQPNLKKYRSVGADQPHALKELQYYKGKMLA